MEVACKICGSQSLKIFDAMILTKYKADYFQCENCGFIQTEKPYWLNEAYVSAITSLDVGLIYRNVELADTIPSILHQISKENDAYIDYGGGYGMFVRMMRDKGYDFYLQDLYADNLFAKYFTINDYKGKNKFACLTAFEVFEHLEYPGEELHNMFSLSGILIFSTLLQAASSFNDSSEWWYFVPETGQHISLFTRKSLEILSEKHGCNMYTNGINLHIFSKEKLLSDPFIIEIEKKSLLERVLNKLLVFFRKDDKELKPRESLLQKDFELYRKHLHE